MTLFVINPNSSETVTAGIDRAVDPYRRFGIPIECLTLSEGPPGIENQAQADRVVPPLLDLAERLRPRASGFVIACFGDPGLHAMRVEQSAPVLGIQECAVMTALTLGQRFGIISILDASIPRHMRSLGAMGVLDRCAGDVAIGRGVGDLTAGETLDDLTRAAERLKASGAEVGILGCAGMAAYPRALEERTGLKIVEPCQAAVGMALTRIALEDRT
ncbi:MAG: aspartate/glutamate racemase family protein [Rubricella sp.]